MASMINLRLEDEMVERLNALAERTGRTKTFYVKEAVRAYIENLEDAFMAIERLRKPAKTLSMEEMEKALGLDSEVGQTIPKRPQKPRQKHSKKNS